jgi:repressor LexA
MIGDPPTDRQLELLRFISRGLEIGRCPTIREIGDHFDISSTNGVSDHLVLLERKGFIVRREREARGLALTDVGRSWVDGAVPKCPACGQRIRRAA